MNVLFDNKILNATLSASNENANFPIDNLKSDFLRERFQSTDASDTITVTFDNVTSLDCLFWGYTNMTSMTVVLKDDLGNTIDTIYFSGGDVAHYYGYDSGYYGYTDYYYGYFDRLAGETVYDPVSWYFPTIEVKSIEIAIEAVDNVYLGGLATGKVASIKEPLNDWDEDFEDLSIITESEAGQVQQLYNRPLRVYNWTIVNNTREEMNEILDLYKEYGIGHHIWVDPFEDNHEFMTPLYAVLTNSIAASKDGYLYSFNFDIKEAR
jgi:hypothetical protein